MQTQRKTEVRLTERVRAAGCQAQVTLTRQRTARTFGAQCPECDQCWTVDTCLSWHWSKSKALHERGTGHRVYYMNIATEGVANGNDQAS